MLRSISKTIKLQVSCQSMNQPESGDPVSDAYASSAGHCPSAAERPALRIYIPKKQPFTGLQPSTSQLPSQEIHTSIQQPYFPSVQYVSFPQTAYREQTQFPQEGQLPSPPLSPRRAPAASVQHTQQLHEAQWTYNQPTSDIKYERPSQQQQQQPAPASTDNLQPTIENLSSSSMSISEEGELTPRPFPTEHSPPFNHEVPRRFFDSMSSSTTHAPNTIEFSTRQHELFRGLERACTNAAHAYCRSQCPPISNIAFPKVHRPQRHPRAHHRPHHEPYNPSARLYRPRLPQPSLMDYITRIAHLLWSRATTSSCTDPTSPSYSTAENHARELEAVHRMGNLYAWGEKITRAARGQDVFTCREGVLGVVMAARDLASWLLSEEGKREIEALWALGG